MKTAILVMSIIGAVLSPGIGGCSGACMSGLSDLAGEQDTMSPTLVVGGLIQGLLGLIGGIYGFKNFDNNRRGSKTCGVILILAALISMHNLLQFLTAGFLFIISGILLLVCSGGKKLETQGSKL